MCRLAQVFIVDIKMKYNWPEKVDHSIQYLRYFRKVGRESFGIKFIQ
jgi:dihydroneopterin aldolase